MNDVDFGRIVVIRLKSGDTIIGQEDPDYDDEFGCLILHPAEMSKDFNDTSLEDYLQLCEDDYIHFDINDMIFMKEPTTYIASLYDGFMSSKAYTKVVLEQNKK